MYTPQQVINEAQVYLSRNAKEECVTIRTIANELGVSKSTLHKHLSDYLKKISPELHAQYNGVARLNICLGRIAGGTAKKRGKANND